MDPDSGKFVPLNLDESTQKFKLPDDSDSDIPKHWTTFFDVGEEIVLRGYVFSVVQIEAGGDEIVLKGIRPVVMTRSQKDKNRAKRKRRRRCG